MGRTGAAVIPLCNARRIFPVLLVLAAGELPIILLKFLPLSEYLLSIDYLFYDYVPAYPVRVYHSTDVN